MKRHFYISILVSLSVLTLGQTKSNAYKLTAPDTILAGQKYKCIIDLDSTRYKYCDISLYFHDVKVPRASKYKFIFELTSMLAENTYEIKVKIRDCKTTDTTFTIKNRFHVSFNKIKSTGTKATKAESEILIQGKTSYKSNKYKSFEEYILASLQSTKIKSREKIHFLYDIDVHNKITFVDVTIGSIDADDKLIIKTVVESCKDLTLTNKKANSYRTLMPLDLSKLK